LKNSITLRIKTTKTFFIVKWIGILCVWVGESQGRRRGNKRKKASCEHAFSFMVKNDTYTLLDF
jgi:hypothetical protein